MLWPLVPIALGEASRTRRELLIHAEAEREREAQRRVDAERTRIAGEFHDVVAHTIVAVNVQMAAAVAAFDHDPGTARRALAQARASSKDAMQELRATVAVMRQSDDTTPAPRLDQLAGLADTARAAGITITINDKRNGTQLSGAAELAAYRLVQEALTNVVRHSSARHAAVSLHDTADGLVVEVADDGITAFDSGPPATSVGGFGLIGMAERVHAVGGRLDHGPTREGGFRVRAVLPHPTA
jgi:signal transduction histidine kinase